MDFLDKIAPLLEQVGLHMGFSKKGDTYYLSLLPVASAEGVDPALYTMLTPIIMSGTLEELKGATFEQGFQVLNQGLDSIVNATRFIQEAKALEDAAKKKKTAAVPKTTPAAKPEEKKGITSTEVKAQVKPAGPSKPELFQSKYDYFIAIASTGWNGVKKVKDKLKEFSVPEEMQKELDQVFAENENKGKPAEAVK